MTFLEKEKTFFVKFQNGATKIVVFQQENIRNFQNKFWCFIWNVQHTNTAEVEQTWQ